MGIQEALIATVATMNAQNVPYRERLTLFNRQVLIDALERNGWNISRTSEALGIPYGAVRWQIIKLKIEMQPTKHRPHKPHHARKWTEVFKGTKAIS